MKKRAKAKTASAKPAVRVLDQSVEIPERDGIEDIVPQAAEAVSAEEPSFPLESVPVVDGVIDQVDFKKIVGRAWQTAAPARRMKLELLEDDIVLAETATEWQFSKTGEEMRVFHFDLSPIVRERRRHEFLVRCAETQAVVPGCPIIVDTSAFSIIRCFVDAISDDQISGWIAFDGEPVRHGIVSIVELGQPIARTVASTFREDLFEAGIGDGCHAFFLPMPASYTDGEQHTIRLFEETSQTYLTEEPILWRSDAGTNLPQTLGKSREIMVASASGAPVAEFLLPDAVAVPASGPGPLVTFDGTVSPARGVTTAAKPKLDAKFHLLFDITDLIAYISHHPNLSGIQRVQSSIVIALIKEHLTNDIDISFISYDGENRHWMIVPNGFLVSWLCDLLLPEADRLVDVPKDLAKHGRVPGAKIFDPASKLSRDIPSALCLLGAGWVYSDYFSRILPFKRTFGTKFLSIVYDLIPIYAKDTADAATAAAFNGFFRRALRHVDHFLSISECTASDLRRYAASFGLPAPSISVTRLGSTFDEFIGPSDLTRERLDDDFPKRFVLFVSTIEGRKNHKFLLDLWKRMIERGEDPPTLVCVGRIGWKSHAFIKALVESDYLDGKIVILQDVDDIKLKLLYQESLFTIYPSTYEGWGLPIGEALAAGKICVCGNQSSLPEAGGDFGTYIDLNDVEGTLQTLSRLIHDDDYRMKLEAHIAENYVPITWHSIAGVVLDAFKTACTVAWPEPYPYPLVPFGAEVSLGAIGNDDGNEVGDALFRSVLDVRKSYFSSKNLREESFLIGEDLRFSGNWSAPEPWGTWLGYSKKAEFAFALPPCDSEYYDIFMRVRFSGPMLGTRFRFTSRRKVLLNAMVKPGSFNVIARIDRPKDTCDKVWRTKISIETDIAPDVLDQLKKLDQRLPVLGLERLMVVPEDDVRTKIDLLTRFTIAGD